MRKYKCISWFLGKWKGEYVVRTKGKIVWTRTSFKTNDTRIQCMREEGIQKCTANHWCYFKKYKFILLLCDNDMLVVGSYMKEIKRVSEVFWMKDSSQKRKKEDPWNANHKRRGILWLFQADCINLVLYRFNISDAKPVCTPLANYFPYPRTNLLRWTKKENSWLKFHILQPLKVWSTL